jgi:predicted transcriptional regulator YheO
MQQARSLLDALLSAPEPDVPAQPDEHIGRDLVSVMDAMIGEAIGEAGKPVAQMSRDDKIGVLQRLDARGATQMRKSVETIAMRLGISRVTAYAYLDEARRAEG